jgi:hypothetical protein
VLYAVPTGDEGDADGDGTRSATGDEFVELINPHTRPIRLKGYVITDGRNLVSSSPRSSRREPAGGSRTAPSAPGAAEPKEPTDRKSRIRFELPDLTLQPGQVVVVFNGFKGKGAQPVTDRTAAPKPPASVKQGSPAPIILTMGVTSQYAAFANTGDCVLLMDPKGNGIQCIAWGEKTKPPEDAAPLLERAPEARGSVARVGLARGLGAHAELDLLGRPFSPGVHELTPAEEVAPIDSPVPVGPLTPDKKSEKVPGGPSSMPDVPGPETPK